VQLRYAAPALLHPAFAATPADVIALMEPGPTPSTTGAGDNGANLPLVALSLPVDKSAHAVATSLGGYSATSSNVLYHLYLPPVVRHECRPMYAEYSLCGAA
jgi:hypothetical protein